jgi:hypothetical protein
MYNYFTRQYIPEDNSELNLNQDTVFEPEKISVAQVGVVLVAVRTLNLTRLFMLFRNSYSHMTVQYFKMGHGLLR